MKNFLHVKLTKIVSLALLLNLTSAVTVFAALHGAYTINASGGATATNYKTFASAVSDMTSGTRADGGPVQGSGVSAAVTFTVAAGTYNEQLTVPAITGASAINTITFDGQNPANCTLFATPNSTYEGLVTFNACSYVTVKNLTITTSFTTAPYDFGVAFVGTAAITPCNNNTLQNCKVSVPIDYTYFNYQYALTFVRKPGTGGDSYQGYFNNNTVSGCTLSGGNWDCVFLYGNNGYCAGNVIKGNTISGGITNANVDIENFDNIKFINNYINSLTPATSIALYATNCLPTANDFVDISGNTLNVYSEGMYISANPGTASYPMRISNNFIYSTLSSATDAILLGGYAGGNSYVNVYHNSLNFSAPCTGYPYHDDGSNNHVNINDNIFSYSATSGAGIPFNLTGSSGELTSFNNNIFYNAASTTKGSVNGTAYTTSAVGGGSFNTASFATNPNFVSATNLHIQSPSLTQAGVSVGITTDIDGQTRPTPPHIGADDFATGNSGFSNDLSAMVLTSPGTSTLSGSQTITVQVYNTGSNTVSTGNVNYVLNGGSVVTQALSSSLASGANTSFSFTTPANLLAGMNTIKVYTSQPNGVTDANTNNDTITTTWYSALSGTYTINGSLAASATNFVSFTSAAAAVNNGFILGPVVINVAAGTYTEQIEFTAGTGTTSATNTVMFNGGSAANVTLQYSGAPESQHTIRLNGCSYINFTNMAITATGTNYGWPVHFFGNYTNHNRFANCTISVPANGSENLVPVIATSNLIIDAGYSPGGCLVGYNRIDTCVITNGQRGIDWYGNGDNVNCVGNIFQGNTITNATAFGMNLSSTFAPKVWNNTITMPNSGTGIFLPNSGISAGAKPDYMDISFNTITGFTGGQSFGGGIAEAPCTGSASLHNRISNNIVVSAISPSSSVCLLLGAGFTGENPRSISSYTDIDFNTLVNQDTGSGTGNCVYWFNFDQGDNSSFNNNIAAVIGAKGTSYPVNYYNGSILSCDYNIFYNTLNSNIISINSTTYTSSTVIGGGGFNTHSQVTNPNFVSATDFFITAQCPRGITIAGMPVDITSSTRANPPTIGAEEIPSTGVAAAGTISGPGSVCAGQGGYVYSVAPVSGATSYSWTLPVGATITGASNTNSIVVNFSASAITGNITVRGNSACGSGVSSPAFAVTVNPLPALSGNLTPPAICTGTTFSYTPASTTAGCTFAWSRAVIIGISNAANSGSDNPDEILNLTNPTGNPVVVTYIYTITSPATCSAQQNVTITVNSLPALSFTTPSPVNVCSGGSGGTLTAKGAATYTWAPSTGLSATTGASVTANPADSLTYYVTGTDLNGCSSVDSITLNVEICTGVEPLLSDNNKLIIFPNPTSGQFTLLNDDKNAGTLEIYNLVGQKVYQSYLSNPQNVVNLGTQAAGMYFVYLKSERKQRWGN